MPNTPKPATTYSWDEMPTDRPMDLISRQRVVGEKMMISRVTLEPGFSVGAHQHPNEQIAVVIEGEIVFTVEEEAGPREIRVKAGECVHLPGNLPHSGRTRTGAVILDCFSPPSESTGVDGG